MWETNEMNQDSKAKLPELASSNQQSLPHSFKEQGPQQVGA